MGNRGPTSFPHFLRNMYYVHNQKKQSKKMGDRPIPPPKTSLNYLSG